MMLQLFPNKCLSPLFSFRSVLEGHCFYLLQRGVKANQIMEIAELQDGGVNMCAGTGA